jgi:hypothetical protein
MLRDPRPETSSPSREAERTGPARIPRGAVLAMTQSISHLADRLLDAADWLQTDEPLAPLAIRLRTLAVTMTSTARGLDTSPPNSTAEWVHALSTPVTAVTGWVAIFQKTQDAILRRRGMAAIERNTAAIEDLIARPPA